MGGIPGRPTEQPRPGPHVENYQVAVWDAFLNNICRASTTQGSNLHHQPMQNQRLHEGVRSSQPPTLQQRGEEPLPAAEIHAEIPDCRRKLLRCLENGGARRGHPLDARLRRPGAR